MLRCFWFAIFVKTRYLNNQYQHTFAATSYIWTPIYKRVSNNGSRTFHFRREPLKATDMESMKGLDNQEGYTSNTSFKVTESEVQSEWTSTTIAITVFLAFLILLTSTGNLVVCRLVWVFRRMRIPSFCFVASMSISDFLMGVLVIPVSLGYHITYQTTGNILEPGKAVTLVVGT